MGEAAGIRVSDLAMPGFVQFWNSKTGEEGYTTRPLYRYADGVRAWLHRHMVSLGRSSDMLVWQSGEVGLEAGMAETLAGTAHARARWHALRRGGAAATWARKPDLAYYKWWGKWQSTAVAMQYGTKWSDPGVVAPKVLPAWSRDRGPLPTPERVGVLALWGSPMFPSIAGALSTPTKRKPRRPRGEGHGSTESGTVGSGDEGDQAATELEESAEDGPAEVGPGPEAAPTPPPLQPLASASERGAVSREDAGQLCTLAGPLVAVGGGGGCGPGTAAGPINVDSNVDTDDNSEGSGSEPDGAFAVGSARGSPGRRQAGVARFVGRERKPWSSRAAAGPVRGGTGAGSKAGVVGRIHRSYTGPRRAKVVVGGAQAMRPRAPARRQTRRPRLAQQIDSPAPKRTKLGAGGHVQTPAARKVPEAAPTPPPLQPLASASERGAVSREDAGQLCTLAGPLVAVGGGGCGPGTAAGPINVDSDMDTDDDSEGSGSEPDGAFAVGSARGSPGRRQAGVARFVGRERKPWSSRAAAGPVRGGTGAGSKAGVVGRIHRSYTGPRRAKVVVGGAQAMRPRAPARRQTGRPRLAQQIDSPAPKRTKLGAGGHVQTPAAQSPVEGAFVAAAERLKAKARGRAGPVASPPPPL